MGLYETGGSDSQMTATERLTAEFDPRLADIWLTVFASGTDIEPVKEQLGWFLRMAYLRGYEDALTEPTKGQLYRSLGLEPPMANANRTDRNGDQR